jgi:hypothetical protein
MSETGRSLEAILANCRARLFLVLDAPSVRLKQQLNDWVRLSSNLMIGPQIQSQPAQAYFRTLLESPPRAFVVTIIHYNRFGSLK